MLDKKEAGQASDPQAFSLSDPQAGFILSAVALPLISHYSLLDTAIEFLICILTPIGCIGQEPEFAAKTASMSTAKLDEDLLHGFSDTVCQLTPLDV